MKITRLFVFGSRRLMIPAMAILVSAVAADLSAQTRSAGTQQQQPSGQKPGQQQPAQPATPQTAKPAPPAGPLTPTPDKTGATPGPQPAGTDTTATAPSTLKSPAAGAKAGAKQPEVAPMQGTAVPADYQIGPDDVLQVVFWQEKDLSAEVVVRPDGKISLPLINEVQASGTTPAQLRTSIMQAASRFVTDPSLTIFVKTINSRKVFVVGQVNKPGAYPLNDSMTVLQMLATAGGLMEYAKGGKITVTRTENGQTKSYKFNYNDVAEGKNLQQNIALRPGDTIVVP